MKTHPALMEWAFRPSASHAILAHERSAGVASHATMEMGLRTVERAIGTVVGCHAADGARQSAKRVGAIDRMVDGVD